MSDALLKMLDVNWKNETGDIISYSSANSMGKILADVAGVTDPVVTPTNKKNNFKITHTEASKNDVEVAIIVPDVHSYARDVASYELCMEAIKVISDSYNTTSVVQLGDLMEGGSLSAHPHSSVYENIPSFDQEVEWAINDFWGRVMKHSPDSKYIQLWGNHEDRMNKFLLKAFRKPDRMSRSIYESLMPNDIFTKMGIEVVPYGNEKPTDGTYELIKDSLYCTHGWSFSTNAAKAHLDKTMGAHSIIFGHTHRIQSYIRNEAIKDKQVGAWSFGALAKNNMFYQKGAPNDHANGFGIVMIDKNGEFFSPIQIPVLRDGKDKVVVLPNQDTLRYHNAPRD